MTIVDSFSKAEVFFAFLNHNKFIRREHYDCAALL